MLLAREKNQLSLKQVQGLVQDLRQPTPWIYWVDFLGSVLTGHALFYASLFMATRMDPTSVWFWPLRAILFVAVVLCFHRAAIFTHELVHLPTKGFQAFRVVWNVLCGIPFLIPSFTYYPHLDHHRRKHYGTEHDGEYVSLSHQGPIHLVGYMLLSFVVPFVLVFRFLILSPICWIFPQVRTWTFHHASSLVMDIMYFRPDGGRSTRSIMFMQEALCFLWLIALIVRGVAFRSAWSDAFLLQGYFVAVAMVFMNNIRTLGAHRWTGDGRELTFEEQLLDSCNYPYRAILTELWGPVGTRYHALHHLLPSLPYHNLGIAHRRLMAALPADSPYRETVRVSLLGEIKNLWNRARTSGKHHEVISPS